MLRSLYVKNLALIDEAGVEFQKGLNILTGETGAGKSLLMGSVDLALGKKADKDEAKAAKKPAAKRSTAKKEKAEKPELKPEVFIEYQHQQASQLSIVDKVKAAFVASGHRASSIKSLQIYIKPEEYKAYYVINDNKYNGEVDLF